MIHTRLMDHYKYVFDTMLFDELYDLTSDDFYFRNPTMEIYGRDNYVQYLKDILGTYCQETIRIYAKSESEYVHEYYLTFLSSSDKFFDKLFVVANITIKDGLISSYIIDYKMDSVSSMTQDILLKPTKEHGVLLDDG